MNGITKGLLLAAGIAAVGAGGHFGYKYISKQNKEMNNLKTEVSQIKEDNEQKSKQIKELSANLYSTNAELTKKQNEISSLNAKLSAKDTELANKNKVISELNTTLDEKTTELNNLSTSLSQKTTELETANTEISTLSTQKVFLLNAVTEIDNKINSTSDAVELETLQARKSAILSQIDTLNTQISTLSSDKSNLETEVSNLEADKTTLQNQISTLQTEKSSLEKDKLTLEQQISTLQTEKANLEQQIIDLSKQISSLQSQVEALENETGVELDYKTYSTSIFPIVSKDSCFGTEYYTCIDLDTLLRYFTLKELDLYEAYYFNITFDDVNFNSRQYHKSYSFPIESLSWYKNGVSVEDTSTLVTELKSTVDDENIISIKYSMSISDDMSTCSLKIDIIDRVFTGKYICPATGYIIDFDDVKNSTVPCLVSYKNLFTGLLYVYFNCLENNYFYEFCAMCSDGFASWSQSFPTLEKINDDGSFVFQGLTFVKVDDTLELPTGRYESVDDYYIDFGTKTMNFVNGVETINNAYYNTDKTKLYVITDATCYAFENDTSKKSLNASGYAFYEVIDTTDSDSGSESGETEAETSTLLGAYKCTTSNGLESYVFRENNTVIYYVQGSEDVTSVSATYSVESNTVTFTANDVTHSLTINNDGTLTSGSYTFTQVTILSAYIAGTVDDIYYLFEFSTNKEGSNLEGDSSTWYNYIQIGTGDSAVYASIEVKSFDYANKTITLVRTDTNEEFVLTECSISYNTLGGYILDSGVYQGTRFEC